VASTGDRATVGAGASFRLWEAPAAGDGDLIDDDALLTEEDRERPAIDASDCATKKRACKNCTCGRAEEEAAAEAAGAASTAVKLSLGEEVDTAGAQSACGSCYLGDAFRCATCPYRGTPAFQPGEKIKLDLASDL